MQEQILHWFIEGGMFMWLVLLAGIFSLLVIIVIIAACGGKKRKLCLKVMAFFVFTPLLMGALGQYVGYTTLMSVIGQVDPPIREEIYEGGMIYARMPTILGAIISSVLMIVALAGLRIRKK